MNKHLFLFSNILFLIIGGILFLLNIGDWLSLSEEPQKSDIIICLNSSKARVQKVAELFRQGYGDNILVTYKETRKLVTGNGVPDSVVLSLDSKPNSTYEEALQAMQFITRKNLHSAIIVSDPYHMYRAKWTYRHLTDSDAIQLTYVASESIRTKKHWWNEQKSRMSILNEIPKVAYYWVGHGFLGINYDPQWISDTEHWCNKILKYFV